MIKLFLSSILLTCLVNIGYCDNHDIIDIHIDNQSNTTFTLSQGDSYCANAFNTDNKNIIHSNSQYITYFTSQDCPNYYSNFTLTPTSDTNKGIFQYAPQFYFNIYHQFMPIKHFSHGSFYDNADISTLVSASGHCVFNSSLCFNEDKFHYSDDWGIFPIAAPSGRVGEHILVQLRIAKFRIPLTIYQKGLGNVTIRDSNNAPITSTSTSNTNTFNLPDNPPFTITFENSNGKCNVDDNFKITCTNNILGLPGLDTNYNHELTLTCRDADAGSAQCPWLDSDKPDGAVSFMYHY